MGRGEREPPPIARQPDTCVLWAHEEGGQPKGEQRWAKGDLRLGMHKTHVQTSGLHPVEFYWMENSSVDVTNANSLGLVLLWVTIAVVVPGFS